jgi:hypothetical protein
MSVKSIDLYKFLFKSEKISNLPLSNNVTKIGAEECDLEVLKSAIERGCPLNSIGVYFAARRGHLDVLQWFLKQPMSQYEWKYRIEGVYHSAAEGGQLKIIQWLRENDYPWDSHVGQYAARGGHLETFVWLHEHGFPLDKDSIKATIHSAIAYGHLEILKWLKTQECTFDYYTLWLAAQNGHFEIFKWLREQKCPWDKSISYIAKENGHLELLQWAIENGCPN